MTSNLFTISTNPEGSLAEWRPAIREPHLDSPHSSKHFLVTAFSSLVTIILFWLRHRVSQVELGQETLQCEAPQGRYRANTHGSFHGTWQQATTSGGGKRTNTKTGWQLASPLFSFVSAFCEMESGYCAVRERERVATARCAVGTLPPVPSLAGLKTDNSVMACLWSVHRRTSVGVKVEVWTKWSDARQRELLAAVSWLTVRLQYDLCWSNSNKACHLILLFSKLKAAFPQNYSVRVFQSFINAISLESVVLSQEHEHEPGNDDVSIQHRLLFFFSKKSIFFSAYLHSNSQLSTFVNILLIPGNLNNKSRRGCLAQVTVTNSTGEVNTPPKPPRTDTAAGFQIPQWVLHWKYDRRRTPNYYAASQSTSALCW